MWRLGGRRRGRGTSPNGPAGVRVRGPSPLHCHRGRPSSCRDRAEVGPRGDIRRSHPELHPTQHGRACRDVPRVPIEDWEVWLGAKAVVRPRGREVGSRRGGGGGAEEVEAAAVRAVRWRGERSRGRRGWHLRGTVPMERRGRWGRGASPAGDAPDAAGVGIGIGVGHRLPLCSHWAFERRKQRGRGAEGWAAAAATGVGLGRDTEAIRPSLWDPGRSRPWKRREG